MLSIWKFIRHQITLAAGNIISLSVVRKEQMISFFHLFWGGRKECILDP
jgi:hypothetical protein